MRRGIRSPLYAFSLEIDIVGFWVGKCIGGGNMKYFANFTLSVVVSFLYIIVSRIPIVFRFINSLCSVSSSPCESPKHFMAGMKQIMMTGINNKHNYFSTLTISLFTNSWKGSLSLSTSSFTMLSKN